jgi:hypothetical protein
MRVKKRLKKRVKKGIKSVKSASPEAYLAGAGGLVGSAAVVVLTATKSGRELLVRTAQLARRSEADEPEESDSEESDVQDEAPSEPAGEGEVKEKPEADTNGETSPRPHKPEAAHSANARSAGPARPRSQG